MTISHARVLGSKEQVINMVQFKQWLDSEQLRMEQREEDLQWQL